MIIEKPKGGFVSSSKFFVTCFFTNFSFFVYSTLSFLTIGCSFTKEADMFELVKFDLSESGDSMKYQAWKEEYLDNAFDSIGDSGNVPGDFYSDDNFIVQRYCMGEFGGDVQFFDAKDWSTAYFLQSTCPVMIDCIDGDYFLVESLCMLPSGKLKRIADPKKLVAVSSDSLYEFDWKSARYPNSSRFDISNRLSNQGDVLLDTVGISLGMFFRRDNKDFLLYSDMENTYLGVLENGQLVLLDTLLNVPSYDIDFNEYHIVRGFRHYGFFNRGKYGRNSGHFYIRNDTIVLAYKQEKNTVAH